MPKAFLCNLPLLRVLKIYMRCVVTWVRNVWVTLNSARILCREFKSLVTLLHEISSNLNKGVLGSRSNSARTTITLCISKSARQFHFTQRKWLHLSQNQWVKSSQLSRRRGHLCSTSILLISPRILMISAVAGLCNLAWATRRQTMSGMFHIPPADVPLKSRS